MIIKTFHELQQVQEQAARDLHQRARLTYRAELLANRKGTVQVIMEALERGTINEAWLEGVLNGHDWSAMRNANNAAQFDVDLTDFRE